MHPRDRGRDRAGQWLEQSGGPRPRGTANGECLPRPFSRAATLMGGQGQVLFHGPWRRRQDFGLDSWIPYAPGSQIDTELHASLPLVRHGRHEHVQRIRASLLGYAAALPKVPNEIVQPALVADPDLHRKNPLPRRRLSNRVRSQMVSRACSVCGCIIPATKRRCSVHEREENARRAEKATKAGLKTAGWQHLRLARLQLDGYRCTFQLDGCTGYATTVHLAPELGGNHRLATLELTRSACRHCHGVTDAPRAHGN
jgi:5-methylcytosine-specific restriction endonuclease McrA